MDRRTFVAGLASATALSMLPIEAAMSRAVPERTLWASSEERLMEMLALIPDSERFRTLLDSEMRWVDVVRQIDAFGSSEYPAAVRGSVLAQGHWPRMMGDKWSRTYDLLQIDQALSIEDRENSEFLSILAGVDSEAVIARLRKLGHREINLDSVTVLVHEEIDYDILENGQFVAVMKPQDAVVYASSESAILEYAGLIASHGPTLDGGDIGSVLAMLRQSSWSQLWKSGAPLDKSKVQFTDNTDPAIVEIREIIRGLEHLEKTRFGVAPEVLKVAVGIDAGISTPNLRNPDATPFPVAEGYEEPSQYIFLQYQSEEAAQRACEIIEWRWENSISYGTGEPLADWLSPNPIDRSNIKAGLISQTFPGRTYHQLESLINGRELSVYGWGTW